MSGVNTSGVFEMSSLVNGYLQSWLDYLTNEYLETSELGGIGVKIPWNVFNTSFVAEINNTCVKDTIIEKFFPGAPFKLRVGKLGQLQIDGWIITLTDLDLLILPNKGILFDAEKEKKNSQELKMKALEEIEKNRQEERRHNFRHQSDRITKCAPAPTWSDYFTGIGKNKLMNFKVIVNNVHIRYEDEFSDSDNPFAVGITIKQLRIFNMETNEENSKTAQMIKKSIEVEDLKIYWNRENDLVSRMEDKNEMVNKVGEVAKIDKNVYVVNSWNPMCEVNYIASPEKQEWKIPQTDAMMIMKDLKIKLNKSQYNDMLMLMDSLGRFSNAEKYRKHRTILSQKGKKKARLLWKFAYNSILHEVVRRRKNEWSWKRMKEHRVLVNSYMVAYLEKRTSSTVSEQSQKAILDAEEKLDLWNLNLARTRVELDIDKRKLMRIEDQPTGIAARISSIFSSGSNTNVTQSISEKEKKKEEEAQKAKLSDSCERIDKISRLPKDYIDNQVKFSMDLIHLTLNDSIDIRLSTVIATAKMRSGAAAIDSTLAVSDISMRGFGSDFLLKQLKKQWFFAQYITNPLDDSFDQKAAMNIQPIEVKLNAETIYEMTRFFSPPSSLMFNQLLSLQLSNYDSLISNTLTGLKHAAAQKQRLMLDMTVHPATVLICEGGRFDEKKKMMVVNCGKFAIGMDSVLDPKLSEEEKTRLMAYHRFAVLWTGLSCGISKNHGDKQIESLFHPISTSLQFHVCAVEDQNLARFRLLGSLPDFVLSVDEKRLLSLIRISLSMPPNKDDVERIRVEKAVRKISSTNLIANVNQNGTVKPVYSYERAIFEADLHMGKIGIEFLSGSAVIIAAATLSKMDANVTMRSFETTMKFEIGDMNLGSSECLIMKKSKSSDTLLNLIVTQVSPDSPEFVTKFKSILSKLEMKFARVECNLIQEPLVSISSTLRKLSKRVNSTMETLSTEEQRTQAQSMLKGVADSISEKASSVLTNTTTGNSSTLINSAYEIRFIGMTINVGSTKSMDTVMEISDIQLNATMRSDENIFEVKLKGISVEDVTEGATHKKILSADIGNHNLTFEFRFVQNLKTNKTVLDTDSTAKLRLAKLKFVYTALWVSRMTMWAAPFSKRISDSAEKIIAEVSKPSVDGTSKMGLDISLESPVIYVPCSYSSNEGLTVNMGALQMKNQITEEKGVLLDAIDVKISKISSAVGALNESAKSILAETMIAAKITRNLTWESNKTRALMAVNVKVEKAEVTLSKAQYVILMEISSGNMQEKIEDDNEVVIVKSLEGTAKDSTVDKSSNVKSSAITLSIEFVANSMNVSLIDENLCFFASIELRGLTADQVTTENGMSRNQMKLATLNVIDNRSNASIKNIFESREVRNIDLIDVIYVQSAERGVKTTVISKPLTIYFNPNFLGTLQKFFTIEKSAEQLDRERIAALTAGSSGKSSVPTQNNSYMNVDISMKELEFVLLDSSNTESSQSLVLSFDIEAHPEASSSKTVAGINNLIIYTADSKDRKIVSYEVLKRTNLSLSYSITDKSVDTVLNLNTLDFRISPSIIRLLSSVSKTFADASAVDEKPRVPQFPNYPNYWNAMPLKKRDFWFLQPLADFVEMSPVIIRSEKGEVTLHRLSITLEDEDRKIRSPLVQFEAEAKASASDWSTRLQSSAEVSLHMNYFNEQIGVWEPVIEQCEVIDRPYEPWRMKITAHTTPSNEAKPDLSISMTADKMMNITISKTFYELTKKLQESFSSARNLVDVKSSSSWPGSESLLVLNKTGITVTIRNSKDLEVVGSEVLKPGRYVDLRAISDCGTKTAGETKEGISALRQKTTTHQLMLVVNGMLRKVTLGNTKRQIVAFKSTEYGNCEIVIKSSVQGGRRLFTLSPILRIKSHLDIDIEILSQKLKPVGKIKVGGSLIIPIDVLRFTSAFFFRSYGETSSTSFNWTAVTARKEKTEEHRQILESSNIERYFRIEIVVKEKKCAPSGSFFVVHLLPPMLLQNLLTVLVKVENSLTIEVGHKKVVNRTKGENMELAMTYLDEKFRAVWNIREEKITNILFTSGKNEIYFGVHVYRCKAGGLRGVLYAPYWIDNNTQLSLTCKAATSIAFDSTDSVGTMFPFSGCDPKGTQKMRISVEKSSFSDKLSMDQVGKMDKFVCKEGKSEYELSSTIRMCTSGLTRVITLSPYYMVSNCGEWEMNVREPTANAWIKVPPKTSIGLYPTMKEPFLIACFSGMNNESIPFPISRNIDTFAHIEDTSVGVSISVNVTSNSAVVYLSPFSTGAAPLHIINNTAHPLHFRQKGVERMSVLAPKKTLMHTWGNLALPPVIEYANGKAKGEVKVDHSFIEKMHDWQGFVVSFFNGRQRTLLFEESHQRAMRAHGSWESDKISMEVRMEMEGISLSLVDNINRREILLAAVTSSDLMWGKRTSTGRFKQFDVKRNTLLEEHFQLYKNGDNRYKSPVIDKIHYDFVNMTLTKGEEKSKRTIIRVGEKAIQAVMSTCKERTEYSLKLSRVQIDNQLDNSPFPCILSIAAPPLSDVVDFTRTPMFELNLVQRNQTHSLVPEIDRLVTSSHPIAIKIDLGVLGELQRFTTSEDDENEKEKGYGEDTFKADFALTELSLEEIAQSWRTMQPKSFYRQLGVGKMKIHLAITSGDGLDSYDLGAATNAVSLVTKFAGVDTVFSLKAIERKNFSCSTAQLQAELSNEWLSVYGKISMGVKTVLGLDVFGNPLQAGREIKSGFVGAAEAMKEAMKKKKASRIAFYTLKSARLIAGHTIGGTTGVLAKVVQTLGKGASTLTFDDEYKKKRQCEIMRKHKPFLKEVPHILSDFGRSVLGGITGVVTKPISAVKKNGIAGLPAGIGKGLVGAVVRPVSSTLDLTSSMINHVRQATNIQWSPEQMRPPRHIDVDCILRPFKINDSIGYAIFKETDNGKWSESEEFIVHGSISENKSMLVTDKRIILTELGATWSSDWAIEYGDIKALDTIQGGVKIVSSKGSKNKGKIVLYRNPEIVNRKMKDTFTKWKNQSN